MLNSERASVILIIFPLFLFLPWPLGPMLYNVMTLFFLKQIIFIPFVPLIVFLTTSDDYALYNALLFVVLATASASNSSIDKLRGFLNAYYQYRWILLGSISIWFLMQRLLGVVLAHQVDQTTRAMWLVSEPSVLAIYVVLTWSACLLLEKRLSIIELSTYGVVLVGFTSSIVVAVSYFILLWMQLTRWKYLVIPLVLCVGYFFFNERLMVLTNASLLMILTGAAFASWRNIPDISIFLNGNMFIFPDPNVQVREKIGILASDILSGYDWLESTYSLFSAGVFSLGIIISVFIYLSSKVNWRKFTLPLYRTFSIFHYTVIFGIFFVPKEYAFVVIINLLVIQIIRTRQ